MRLLVLTLLLVVSLLLGLLLPGSLPVAQSEAFACGDDEIVFTAPAEGMSLFAAAAWIGEHVAGSVTFAPPALKIVRRPEARVLVLETVRLRREQVLGFGQDLLAPHGLVLFDIGRPEQPLWLVESMLEPTVLAGRTVFVAPQEVVRHRFERTPITTAVELDNAVLDRVGDEVLEAVKGSLPPGAAVIPVQATNGFILRGPGRDVHAWMQLIERLDRTPAAQPAPTGAAVPATRDRLEKRLRELEARVAELEAGDKQRAAKK